MEVAKRFRPISYLKTNTADVAKELSEEAGGGTIVITQNGVPAFVCVSFEDYYHSQETNALMKIISMGEKEKAQGKVTALEQAKINMRNEIFGRQAELKSGT